VKPGVRTLDRADLTVMVSLENVAWPKDVRASEQKFRDRLQTFGRGFLGAWVDGELIGMASSQIIDLPGLTTLESWTDLTADGWISKTHQPDGDCIHFVSICVHPRHRGEGVAMALNRARLELAQEIGLNFALTDTRLPGLSRFLSEHAYSGAEEYIGQILAGKVAEPVVNMYLELGFKALGLVPDCMKSDAESAKFGLAMLKALKRL
jgi:GNAT superfamily N-acetyltransferase